MGLQLRKRLGLMYYINNLQNQQRVKLVNSDRKTRICVLFTEFSKLTALIDLYRGILPSFQVFLKRLQYEKPMLHVLHVEMVLLVRDVLSKFLKPDAIPLDVKE